ncbi:MAG: TGS domain-containing protein [Candidatus Bipolaricaulota bacterium]|nr:TGS domain-containing protein [Candidatus Bipolaricaulota bacterium]
MPANLTPEFLNARARFRAAQTTQDRLAALEDMLSSIPKHKGTDKMQADIKRRIAKLRSEKKKPGQDTHRSPDNVQREGAGQVVLLGPPNTGKSSLLAALTHAHPVVAAYPYSTPLPVPGMMDCADISVQLIDLPPVTAEYTEPWVYNLIRQADLALIVLNGGNPKELTSQIDEITKLLDKRRIRLVKKKTQGQDPSIKQLPCRIVINKADLADPKTPADQASSLFPTILTSAREKTGLTALATEVFAALDIIRVYTKQPGRPADKKEPYTLPLGSTVLDAVTAVHRGFTERLRYVRIWGSGKFDGQKTATDHVLQDGDIVEIHLD